MRRQNPDTWNITPSKVLVVLVVLLYYLSVGTTPIFAFIAAPALVSRTSTSITLTIPCSPNINVDSYTLIRGTAIVDSGRSCGIAGNWLNSPLSPSTSYSFRVAGYDLDTDRIIDVSPFVTYATLDPPICSGTATLTLTPSIVSPEGSVLPSVATNLLHSNCNSGTISFKDGPCATGTQVSSCTIASGGCSTGGAFTAPATPGAYTYYACASPPAGTTNSTTPGSATLTVKTPVLFPTVHKRSVEMKVFIDADQNGLLNGSEACYDGNVTLNITGTGAPAPITYNPNTASQICFGGFGFAGSCPVPLYCNRAKTVRLSSQTDYILTLTLPPGSGYTPIPSAGYTVNLDSTDPYTSCTATPLPAVCFSGSVINANFALQVPSIILLPWIQTTGGDVHSNTRIRLPGGPP